MLTSTIDDKQRLPTAPAGAKTTTDFYGSSTNSSFTFDDLKIPAIGLRELTIWGSMVHLEWLVRSLAKVGILLEKLKLCGGSPYGLNITEVMTILCVCPTLKYFTLMAGDRINDNQMSEICRCLPNIVSIDLSYYALTAAFFFVFAKECPGLSEITMRFGSLGLIEDDFVKNLERNYRIRYRDLSDGSDLDVNLLEDILVVWPKLHTLKVPLTTRWYAGILSKNLKLAKARSNMSVRIRSNQ
ncbi:hypothetical protein Vadar_004484 [Vaccinium darrowii]|uniref:Uncharacterized protein n=1 Tax=Vaccinium darrowii TaxID=229202 RepID=A0ACB7ZH64_9ERIC|nr:hypothetical protein Vadar_004484 [Vaccinium darrowii]